MKYAVILTDGCADRPIESIGNKTPLEVANIPHMHRIADLGKVFLVKTVPDNRKPGSDVANLAVMGYDSQKCYTGRSPLEAASIGVELGDNQTSFRANLVTLSDEENYEDKTMLDYSSGEITTDESRALIADIEKELGCDGMHFYGGVSYRHLFVWDNAPGSFELTPPHDITLQKIKDHLPSDGVILDIMKKSERILKNHPINLKRIAEGKNPATSLWIWGEGTKPALDNFYGKNGVRGAVISAVDLIKGIAVLSGMKSIDVPGATGTLSTNFSGKADAAIKALFEDGYDYVYIHLEAPDECGHQRDLEGKIKSLELIDELIVAKVWDALEKSGEDYRIMVMPDHPTPISIGTHSRESVPCVMYRKGDANNSGNRYTEECANRVGEYVDPGYLIMDKFLVKEG